MPHSISRQLTTSEHTYIADLFQRLRDHFHEWRDYGDDVHDLVGFAYYEECGGTDCCGRLLAEAAPIALGHELVRRYGFEWAMVRCDNAWHFAVSHPSLSQPIDLQRLEDGSWNDEDYDEPTDPGEMTHESLETILLRVGAQEDSKS
ncbi:MAG: hypothetical protein H6818_08825 [Phycisphaerales bacterium]|nr:hypothetical protein [Phycisphaerales bacterium]MCB9862674.1 hypothetical protein [Phycisphaerales bacterium]